MNKLIILLALMILALGALNAKPVFIPVEGGSMYQYTSSSGDSSYDDYDDTEDEDYSSDETDSTYEDTSEYQLYSSEDLVDVPSFQMANKEVTVGDFKQFVKKTKYQTTAEIVGKGFGLTGTTWEYTAGLNWKNPGYEQNDSYPVACISWYDAISYCNWLSVKDHLKPVYKINQKKADPYNDNAEDTQKWLVTWDQDANGYRLPTIAEWEYAARNQGEDRAYVWGDDAEPYNYAENEALANVADETENDYFTENDDSLYAYLENYNDGYAFAAPVGTYPPDELGFYDLGGNVSEWCWNWENDDYFTNAYDNDLMGPAEGTYRSRRGANWTSYESELYLIDNVSVNTDYPAFVYFGMRLAKNAE